MFEFKDSFWALPPEARAASRAEWLAGLRAAAPQVEVYQLFPAESGADILVWSALPAEDSAAAAGFFEAFARATNPHRAWLRAVTVLWGCTRPSQYTRTRSAQELDPFAATRRRYLVLYPFAKTPEWYLLGREVRQGMMNEHIRLGKQYEDIAQLLLYSFGLQDQEFVVVYETDDLQRFSDLVHELRSTEARRYTLRDTPVHTAVHHPAEETLALWS